MTDPEKLTHWDSLVEQLGVTPTPEESERPAAAVPTPPKATKGAPPRAPRAPIRRAPADWSQIASELGVDGVDEPPLAPEAADAMPVETCGAEAPAAVPECLSEPESLRRDLVPADSEAKLPESLTRAAELSARAEPGEEKKSGRKRRKRRRRLPQEAEEATVEAEAESADFEADDDFADEAVPEPSHSPEADASDAAAGRSKRRRRRRGAGRAKDAETRGDERAEPDDSARDSAAHHREETSDDEDKNDADPAPRKPGKERHVGIPNWQEAVGILIAANLERRAKNPNGSSRPRGGRSRAGRDKSGETSG
jgi:hypothetical protein